MSRRAPSGQQPNTVAVLHVLLFQSRNEEPPLYLTGVPVVASIDPRGSRDLKVKDLTHCANLLRTAVLRKYHLMDVVVSYCNLPREETETINLHQAGFY